ncbi:MAG TPA: D-alanyl-D-alanine carboxypeptidase family protein [Chlamydiales bacterium]|jgi:D-alanyl-D-alanine carboxypeptidase (penicillin-binding protein 5/6)
MIRLILCALCLFLGRLTASPLNLQVEAHAALLINAETGAVLFEKEAHTPIYPASTTKLATALFFMDQKKIPLDQMVTVSREAVHIESDGSSMGLLRGEVLNVEALLHGLLLVSGNDAANVLAEIASGTVGQFMQELNQYLQQIGCKESHFVNPYGYHHAEHVSTAADLALIAQKVIQQPILRSIAGKASYQKPKTNKQPSMELKQTNGLLKPGKYFYSKAIGLKTGRHSASGNNLVAAATHEERTLIAVVLGCETNAIRFSEAKKLFEAAFNEKKVIQQLLPIGGQYVKKLEGAKGPLKAALAQNLIVSFYPAEKSKLKAYLSWETLSLPVRKGQKVGEIRAIDERGAVMGVSPLVALEEVKPTLWFTLKSWWNQL